MKYKRIRILGKNSSSIEIVAMPSKASVPAKRPLESEVRTVSNNELHLTVFSDLNYYYFVTTRCISDKKHGWCALDLTASGWNRNQSGGNLKDILKIEINKPDGISCRKYRIEIYFICRKPKPMLQMRSTLVLALGMGIFC